MRASIPGDRLYFKAPARPYAYEAALLEIMGNRRPDLLPAVVASEPENGWLLLRDAGRQLSQTLDAGPDPTVWEEALPLYAELQIAVAPDASALASVLPLDRRLGSLPARYDELLADTFVLRVGRAGGLTGEEYEGARRLAGDVAAGCAELAAYGVPESIQNDDLSDGSIFLDAGRYRFLDWGDACVTHPFCSLAVTLRVIEHRHGLAPGSAAIDRIRDAYLEPWTRFEPRATLLGLAATGRRIGQACRAIFYRYSVRNTAAGERDPEDAPWSLRLFVDPEAWRALT